MGLVDSSIASVREDMQFLERLKGNLDDLKSTLNLKTMKEENFVKFLHGTTGGYSLEASLSSYTAKIEKIITGYDKLVSQTNAFLDEQEAINSKKA